MQGALDAAVTRADAQQASLQAAVQRLEQDAKEYKVPHMLLPSGAERLAVLSMHVCRVALCRVAPGSIALCVRRCLGLVVRKPFAEGLMCLFDNLLYANQLLDATSVHLLELCLPYVGMAGTSTYTVEAEGRRAGTGPPDYC